MFSADTDIGVDERVVDELVILVAFDAQMARHCAAHDPHVLILRFLVASREHAVEHVESAQEAPIIVVGLDDAHRLQLQHLSSAHEETLRFFGETRSAIRSRSAFLHLLAILSNVVELYDHTLGASEAHGDLNVQRGRGRAVQTNGKLRNVQNHAHSAIKRTKSLTFLCFKCFEDLNEISLLKNDLEYDSRLSVLS